MFLKVHGIAGGRLIGLDRGETPVLSICLSISPAPSVYVSVRTSRLLCLRRPITRFVDADWHQQYSSTAKSSDTSLLSQHRRPQRLLEGRRGRGPAWMSHCPQLLLEDPFGDSPRIILQRPNITLPGLLRKDHFSHKRDPFLLTECLEDTRLIRVF